MSRTVSREVSMTTLFEGWLDDVPQVRINGLTSDAARIETGNAWVVRGRVDASDAARAKAAGAAIVIHDSSADMPESGIPSLAVADLENRVSELAARFFLHPASGLKIAGVAGSASTASAVHYLAQSWQRVNGAAGLVGEAGHGPFKMLQADSAAISDPLALQASLSDCLESGAGMVALEALPQLLERGWLDEIAFDVAVFTGQAGSRAVPREEPASQRLFTECRPQFAVVDHDDAEGKTLTRLVDPATQVLTYGTNGATELQGSILGMDSTGMNLSIASPWGGGDVRTGLLGRRNLSNLLAAAGALALMGMPWDKVMHQIEIMSAVPGRMNCLAGERGQPAAVIDGARTAEELEEVLLTLRSHLHGRLACVLASGAEQQAEMVDLAESLADRVFTATPARRREAIRLALSENGPGDIVLIAGMGLGDWQRNGEAAVRDLLEEAA